jgi:dihydroxyacid dehydratase/phosphogluconate dehydratase
MSRSMTVLSLAAALALVAPGAAAAKTVKFTGTAKVRSIEGSTLAGTTTSTLGRGAVVYTTKEGPNSTMTVTFTLFQAAGTLKGTSVVTLTPGQNGAPTTLAGTARFAGGTGRYRRASGRFTVAGQIASDGLVTLRSRNGTLTYPG